MQHRWTDWAMWLGGGVLAAAGLALLAWALFADRARGRRRCPGCWYSMDAAEPDDSGSFTCPECGRRIRRERALLRTRRRWRWVAAAAVLVLAGIATRTVPAYRQGGWLRATPTTALVLAAPIEFNWMGPPWGPQSPWFSKSDPLADELLRRADAREIAPWQWRLFIDRAMRAEPRLGDWLVATRDDWPLGCDIRAAIRPGLLGLLYDEDVMVRARVRGSDRWGVRFAAARLGEPSFDQRRPVIGPAPLEPATLEIEAEIWLGVEVEKPGWGGYDIGMASAKRVWRGVVRELPVREQTSIQGLQSQWTDERVAAALQPRFFVDDQNEPWLLLRANQRHIGGSDVDWGVGLRAEVRRDAQLIAAGEALYDMPPPHDRIRFNRNYHWQACEMEWLDIPRPFDPEQAAWTLTLTSDPCACAADYQRTYFWEGKIEMQALPPHSPQRAQQDVNKRRQIRTGG